MTLRAIHTASVDAVEPVWMGPFLASLARDDLAPATLRGYRYDLRHFLAWHRTVQDIDYTPHFSTIATLRQAIERR